MTTTRVVTNNRTVGTPGKEPAAASDVVVVVVVSSVVEEAVVVSVCGSVLSSYSVISPRMVEFQPRGPGLLALTRRS